MMGLQPHEFWAMTPREYVHFQRGWYWRFDRQAEVIANMTAALGTLQMPKGKSLKARDLYKPAVRLLPAKSKDDLKVERHQHFVDLAERLDPNRVPIRVKPGRGLRRG